MKFSLPKVSVQELRSYKSSECMLFEKDILEEPRD